MPSESSGPSLRVWVGQLFDAEGEKRLKAGLDGHELLRPDGGTESNLTLASPCEKCRSADVVFGQPVVSDLLDNDRLRWAALSTAGYTRYDNDEVRNHFTDRRIPLTNASGVYDEPCAQHVLAQILAGRRALPESADAAARHKWEYDKVRGITHLLTGTVAIFGYGAIAIGLVQLLAPFNVEIVGVRRRARGDEAIPIIETDDESAVNDLLARADHVVNILPAHPGTTHYFNAERLGLIRPSACYYSIGRGSTTDQQALIAALQAGRLQQAWLDVTDPEPLPASDPLWDAPRCYITPHVAGGLQREDSVLVGHFLANFERLLAGEPLTDRIV
ncbi:MAG: D-2-hydroxyacid dehydrogenase [Planctomycetota bacterium]